MARRSDSSTQAAWEQRMARFGAAGGTLRAKMSETIASPFISVEGVEATDESSLTEVGRYAGWGRSSVD